MLNKKNIFNFIGIGCLCLFLLGCSEESFLVQENLSETPEDSLIQENLIETAEGSDMQEKDSALSVEETKEPEDREELSKQIAVHICGAVNQPGVYYLTENQRLHEAIAKAGGFREDADEDYLNQALLLEDGMKIEVPSIEETRMNESTERTEAEEEASSPKIQSSQNAEKIALQNGYLQKKENVHETELQEQKIDLNTADETLLCTLPGIGESRAKSIIAYRQEHGPFQSTEEVMNISGIKEAAYSKIKDYITVSK